MDKLRAIAVLVSIVCLNSGCARSVASVGRTGARAQPAASESGSFAAYLRTVNRIAANNAALRQAEREALVRVDPALGLLMAHLEANPSDLAAKQKLAVEFLGRGHHWSAYELFQELEWRSPGRWDVAMGLAAVWDAWGRYDLALEYAGTAASSRPSRGTYELLGRIELHGHNFPGAEAAFRTALEFDPSDAALLSNLGFALMSQSKWGDAREQLVRARSMNPGLVEARNNLAIVFARTGDFDGALGELIEVSAPAVAWNNLGALYLQQERPGDAYRAFTRAVELDPDYERASYNLAKARSRLPLPAVVHLGSGRARPVEAPGGSAGEGESPAAPVTSRMEADAPTASPASLAGDAVNPSGQDRGARVLTESANIPSVPSAAVPPPAAGGLADDAPRQAATGDRHGLDTAREPVLPGTDSVEPQPEPSLPSIFSVLFLAAGIRLRGRGIRQKNS